MADSDNRVSDLDIDATNVLPAYDASLQHGIAQEALQERLGWSRGELLREGATVQGASTYAHMEWMAERPDFASFVLSAVCRHAPASLGVVGLACKTASTVAEALACHQRFQHLTNRTAHYASRLEGAHFVIRETRFGTPSMGSFLVSDYTLLVAVHMLRALLGASLPLRSLHSRREALPPAQRDAWQSFAGAPMLTGSSHARLVFDASFVEQRVPSADTELASYFEKVLQAAAPKREVEAEPPPSLEERVRIEIAQRLRHGTPNTAAVARALGLGSRTLARRLAASDQTFGGVLESVRKEQARRYLGDRSLSLAEIAYLLGYAEHASFFRAFRRWFAVTPAAYRAQGEPPASDD